MKCITQLLCAAVMFGGLILSSCVTAQQSKFNADTAATSSQTSGQIASIPAEVFLGGGILLQARVNDSDPLWFALDSGGGDGFIVDARRAKMLKLDTQGNGKSIGAGERPVDFARAKDVTIKLQGVEFPSQTVAVIALDSLEPFSGHQLDGIVGYGMFSRHVVEIDYAARRVNLYDSQKYKYAGAGTHLPLTVEKQHFFVQATIAMPDHIPVTGKFMIDTGAPTATLVLNSPFVTKRELLPTKGRIILDRSLPGLGGETKQLLGRADKLQLSDLVIQRPMVSLSQDVKGSLASPDFDGIIGGELLRRFKVIFDLTHNELILEPNEHLNEPYEHNMSGLGLRAEGNDFKVIKVYRIIENSPASLAGLREDDEIAAIDKTPAATLTLDQIYQMFKCDGRTYDFDILRGKEKLHIKIVLKRLI
ncbi:MAG: hypothetical protein NVSMB56_03870 [Pyrinomonadaceae bacterium]